MSAERPREVPVWDPVVRVVHWSLVATFAVAFLTEDDVLLLHVWAGYAVGVLVAVRLAWGLVGTRYARFSDFVYPAAEAAAYVRDLLLFRGRRYLGHSPGGGAMVVLLLASLALTVVSGLAAYGAGDGKGPLAPLFAASSVGKSLAANAALAAAREDDDDDDEDGKGGERKKEGKGRGERGEAFEAIHEFFAQLTLYLVVIHVGGVLLASLVHRENLVRAMIDGRKRADGIASRRPRSG